MPLARCALARGHQTPCRLASVVPEEEASVTVSATVANCSVPAVCSSEFGRATGSGGGGISGSTPCSFMRYCSLGWSATIPGRRGPSEEAGAPFAPFLAPFFFFFVPCFFFTPFPFFLGILARRSWGRMHMVRPSPAIHPRGTLKLLTCSVDSATKTLSSKEMLARLAA